MTTFYVSPAGSDANPGTKALPFQTFAHAAALRPGDTLRVRRGYTYTQPLTVPVSGTAQDPIIIASYGNHEDPVLAGGVVLSGSHLTLTRVVAAGLPRIGVEVRGTDCTVAQVEAYGNMHGVQVSAGADRARVLNSYLHHNQTEWQGPGPYDDYGACGVVLCADGCEVARTLLTDNVAPSNDFGTDGSAVEIWGAIGALVHHNIARDNRTFTELGNARSAHNTFAFNTVTSDLDHSEFLITRGGQDKRFGPVARTAAYGNLVTLTGTNSRGAVSYAGTTEDVLCLYDNVIEAHDPYDLDGPVAGGGNVWWGGPAPGSLPCRGDRFVDPATIDLYGYGA